MSPEYTIALQTEIDTDYRLNASSGLTMYPHNGNCQFALKSKYRYRDQD